MRLSDVATGRDNNFNLIRFIAALSVLVSHAYAIALGPEAFEPLESWLGYTLGEIAVDVFFASSGFLVCGSLLRLEHLRSFARARILRIYPALLLAILLTALAIGPSATTSSPAQYFLDPATYAYIARNSVLFLGVQHYLPGVFSDAPMAGVVNGSLWTLPFEVWCYALLTFAWLACRRLRAANRYLTPLLVLAMLGCLLLFHGTHWLGLEVAHGFRLFFMFFSGAVFQLLKQHVRLDWRIAATLACAVAASTWSPALFVIVYPMSVAYLVLFAAYRVRGSILAFNRLGDYSYGIYIYAFPVQQLVRSAFPESGIPLQLLMAAAITLVAATISWHLVEKPFLSMKGIAGGNPRHPLARQRVL